MVGSHVSHIFHHPGNFDYSKKKVFFNHITCLNNNIFTIYIFLFTYTQQSSSIRAHSFFGFIIHIKD